MNKQIMIINGRGGVGKDTFCSCAATFYPTRSISSITPIVKIAKFAGWNGIKTPASRKLLSKLKEAFTEFNDLSFQYCLQEYTDFMRGTEQLLFIHVREPHEIARLCTAIGENCHTLLIRRQATEANGPLGNASDDAVLQYSYDFIFQNDGELEGLTEEVGKFLKEAFRMPPEYPQEIQGE